jgi:predicted regulator of Ras-like GTPase activity (Roadblock/LC7/MglB family)
VTDRVEDAVREELQWLRSEVRDVRASLVATSDGLLVADDFAEGTEPSQTAALTSTLVGLARYAVEVTGAGGLVDAVVRGTDGHVAVFAVGDGAVLAVVGGRELNVAMLHHKTAPVVQRLKPLAGSFVRFEDAAARTSERRA